MVNGHVVSIDSLSIAGYGYNENKGWWLTLTRIWQLRPHGLITFVVYQLTATSTTTVLNVWIKWLFYQKELISLEENQILEGRIPILVYM